MKSSILLIDTDPVFCMALQTLLTTSPLLDVVRSAACIADAKKHIDNYENDVYLIDISHPDGRGVELMRYVKRLYPQSKILALSTQYDEQHIFTSIQAGATGYLLKSEMTTNLIQHIINLIGDGGYLSRHASNVLISLLLNERLDALRAPQPTTIKSYLPSIDPNVSLTRKEIEVLHNAQSGTPAKKIADRMGISIFTVNQHLRNIYQKLNARNKMEAVQTAREKGLI